MIKRALITGITGQDGSYLAEFLLDKGYEVHGLVRRSSVHGTERIDHLLADDLITLHDGDLSDSTSIVRVVSSVQPDEIYNLAAQSHVGVSFDAAEYTGDVDALGVLRILEAVHMLGLDKTCKIYQASTSELYGKVEEVPQNEDTPFHPFSPYAVAKQYGFWMVKEYRDAYGMFACNGILFNHESERRGENFVTRKITKAAARISLGLQDHLELGNLDSLRDWGYAKDYIECMWMILQHDILMTSLSLRECNTQFENLSNGPLRTLGSNSIGKAKVLTKRDMTEQQGKCSCVSIQLFIAQPMWLIYGGDPMKAKTVLGWDPQKTTCEELCRIMVEHDLEQAKREAKFNS